MRIDVRIAMPRKVLADRQHAAILQSGGIGDDFIRHPLRVFPERSAVDYGVIGIDVDVRHRGEVYLHPDLPALPRHLFSVFIDQFVVLNTSQYHIPRKNGCAPQSHRQPPFAVESNQERNLGKALRLVGQHCLVLQRSSREEKPPDAVGVDRIVQHREVLFGIHRRNGVDEQLPHLLLEAELFHHRVYPVEAAFVLKHFLQQARIPVCPKR